MLRKSSGGPVTLVKNVAKLTVSRSNQPLIALETGAYEAPCVYFEGKFYAVSDAVADALGNAKPMELFPTVLQDGTFNLFPATFNPGSWRETALEALEMALDQPVLIKSNIDAQEYQATPAKNLTLADFKIPDNVDAFVQAHISQVTLSDLDHPIVKKLLKAQGGK